MLYNSTKLVYCFLAAILAVFCLAVNVSIAQDNGTLTEKTRKGAVPSNIEIPKIDDLLKDLETNYSSDPDMKNYIEKLKESAGFSPEKTTSELSVLEELSDEEIEAKIIKSFKESDSYYGGGETEQTKKEKADIEREINLYDNTEPLTLSLEECLETAIHKNYQIKIAKATRDIDKWQFYQEVCRFIPDIDYEFILTDLNGTFVVDRIIPDKTTETTIVSRFKLRYPLFEGLDRIFSTISANYSYKSAKKLLSFTQNEIILDVTEQYYAVLENKINIDILKVNLEETLEQLRINTQRYKAGIGTKFDVLRAEAEIATAQQDLLVALNVLRLSQATLANTLGIRVFTPIVPEEEVIKTKQLLSEEYVLDELQLIAMKRRNDLQAANLDVKAARALKTAAYSNYIPKFYLEGQLANEGNTDLGVFPNRAIALRVDWMIGRGLGFKGFTEINELSAFVSKSKDVRTNLARNIEEDLLEAYYTTITAKEVIKETRKNVLSAVESRRLSVIRLEAGVGTFIDVLQSQSTATTAKIRYLRSIIAYNISQAQILFDMGVISKYSIINGYDPESETDTDED